MGNLQVGGENKRRLPCLQSKVELYHGDMNNSDDLHTPLNLLRLARSSKAPVVVVDHLGISRSACLVAIELCIISLLKGPSYQVFGAAVGHLLTRIDYLQHLVQRAVHYLRSFRPFAVETPMQYLYIHRVVREFTRPFVKLLKGFDDDYERWLKLRSQRLFVDNQNTKVCALFFALICATCLHHRLFADARLSTSLVAR